VTCYLSNIVTAILTPCLIIYQLIRTICNANVVTSFRPAKKSRKPLFASRHLSLLPAGRYIYVAQYSPVEPYQGFYTLVGMLYSKTRMKSLSESVVRHESALFVRGVMITRFLCAFNIVSCFTCYKPNGQRWNHSLRLCLSSEGTRYRALLGLPDAHKVEYGRKSERQCTSRPLMLSSRRICCSSSHVLL
jgi:hypothetical protein